MAKPVDVSKKMSEKMLLGWALLGDSCPASTCVGVPLMREPKTKLLHCIQCGRKGHSVEEMEAKVEAETVSNGADVESMESSQEENPLAALSSELPDSFEEDGGMEVHEEWKKYEEKRDSASSKMGAYLLQGWAMLSESCPTCDIPIMRDPSTKEALCISCKWSPTRKDSKVENEKRQKTVQEVSSPRKSINNTVQHTTKIENEALKYENRDAASPLVEAQAAEQVLRHSLTRLCGEIEDEEQKINSGDSAEKRRRLRIDIFNELQAAAQALQALRDIK